jgi:hypothetical protein
MTNADKLKEFLTNFDENIVIADGCEHAFIGVSNTPEGYRAVYSTERIISNIMEEDMMGFDEAEEHMYNNILAKDYKGNAPLFVDIVPDEFWKDDTTELGDRTL